MKLNFSSLTTLRVRYGETDQMGYCYYGNYAQYFEIGRLDWITQIGVSYKEMESQGILLPVIYLETSFLKSAYYDDELTIETFLLETHTDSNYFGYNIFNNKNELLTTIKLL